MSTVHFEINSEKNHDPRHLPNQFLETFNLGTQSVQANPHRHGLQEKPVVYWIPEIISSRSFAISTLGSTA